MSLSLVDTKSYCNIHHLTCSIYSRPRHCCNLQSGPILTEMKIHYKLNQISTDYFIIPTRFELYDDFHLRCVWKLRFLFPVKEETPLACLLVRFARLALATDSILMSIGVKTISQITLDLSLLPTDLETLACEFNKLGISVLDDETFKIPDGQYDNSPNIKLDWSILQHFYWTNWDIKREKHQNLNQPSNSSSSSEESSMEAVDGKRRGYDTCGNFSFH